MPTSDKTETARQPVEIDSESQSPPSTVTSTDSERDNEDAPDDAIGLAATASQTPGGPETETGPLDGEAQDNEIVTDAARKLRTLLAEALDNLREHAPVRLSAAITITIADRRTFELNVGTASPDEERLVVKINPSPTQTPASAESRKRPAEPPARSIDTDNPKRSRPNGTASSPAPPAQATTSSDITAAARQNKITELSSSMERPPEEEGERDPDEPEYLRNEFRLLSKQISWVEQCRRTAAAEYHLREETWRTTSASFHDENRVKRESHEAWVAREVARQGNLIGQLLADVRGLYPLVQAAKWDAPGPHPLYPQTNAPVTPAAPTPPAPPAPPAPVGVAYDTPLSFSSSFSALAQMHNPQATPPRGRPRGRPPGSGRGRFRVNP